MVFLGTPKHHPFNTTWFQDPGSIVVIYTSYTQEELQFSQGAPAGSTGLWCPKGNWNSGTLPANDWSLPKIGVPKDTKFNLGSSFSSWRNDLIYVEHIINIATNVIYHEEMTWSFMLNIQHKQQQHRSCSHACWSATHGRRHLPRLPYPQRLGGDVDLPFGPKL